MDMEGSDEVIETLVVNGKWENGITAGTWS